VLGTRTTRWEAFDADTAAVEEEFVTGLESLGDPGD
jgi:hypothetical protein